MITTDLRTVLEMLAVPIEGCCASTETWNERLECLRHKDDAGRRIETCDAPDLRRELSRVILDRRADLGRSCEK
jgi:hypothetical protein